MQGAKGLNVGIFIYSLDKKTQKYRIKVRNTGK